MTGYFGSKAASGLYQNIIAMMPPHDTYIETHLGGGAVMRNKPPARNNIAIDIFLLVSPPTRGRGLKQFIWSNK